ncbi:MAG: NAD(P)H-binding protein [Luminiphilus sp.]|nr:NAD(P)H-binding protein [Luminiphilus sp.]
MNIIVFGATGSIGTLTVLKLLESGHSVTAFARQPHALQFEHPDLKRVAGDVTNPADVCLATAGSEAVIITLGSGNTRSGRVRSEGTKQIIAAMERYSVKRLVCQTTLGAGDSWSNLNFFWKRIMFGVLLRPVFKDHERQEQLVQASNLDWTIVRPSAFTNATPTGALKVDISPDQRGLALKVSRTEVAEFLMTSITESRLLHRVVGISY